MTHLAALSYLRNFYVNHMLSCVWRMGLMFCIIIMFLGAVIIGTPFKTDVGGIQIKFLYAICAWHDHLPNARHFFESVFSCWFIAFGFISRVLKVSRTASRKFAASRNSSRTRLEKVVEGKDVWLCTKLGTSLYDLMFAKPLIAIRIFRRLFLELFASFLTEVSEPVVLVSKTSR